MVKQHMYKASHSPSHYQNEVKVQWVTGQVTTVYCQSLLLFTEKAFFFIARKQDGKMWCNNDEK